SGFFASHGIFAHQPVTAAMRGAAREALARIDVGHLSNTPLAAMSTGEARRVLIARALVHHPRALVLDEPTRGLDLVARHRFMEGDSSAIHRRDSPPLPMPCGSVTLAPRRRCAAVISVPGMASGRSVRLRVVLSSSAAVRLDAARGFIGGHPPGSEVVIIGAS